MSNFYYWFLSSRKHESVSLILTTWQHFLDKKCLLKGLMLQFLKKLLEKVYFVWAAHIEEKLNFISVPWSKQIMSQTITCAHFSVPNCGSSEKTLTAGNNHWITQIIDFNFTLFRGQICQLFSSGLCIFNSNKKTVTSEIILVRQAN